jgi:hypothetical protein
MGLVLGHPNLVVGLHDESLNRVEPSLLSQQRLGIRKLRESTNMQARYILWHDNAFGHPVYGTGAPLFPKGQHDPIKDGQNWGILCQVIIRRKLKSIPGTALAVDRVSQAPGEQPSAVVPP